MKNYARRIVVGFALFISISTAKGTEFTDIWSLGRAGLRADEGKDYANARRNYDAAVQLHPKNAMAYAHRGLFFMKHQQYALAVKDFDTALKLRPTAWDYAYWRGMTYARLGRYDLALANFNQLLSLHTMSDRSSLLNTRAWILATCPDARYRNGQQAVQDATKAVHVGGFGKASYLDTLAAAYAETGDFDSAVKYQQKAIAAQTRMDKLDDGAAARLQSYGQKRPYRDSVR
jgi:tetratricopeptide (TPR) repeat protein